jgi:hypothetical protein
MNDLASAAKKKKPDVLPDAIAPNKLFFKLKGHQAAKTKPYSGSRRDA